jgi:hypothetical protein
MEVSALNTQVEFSAPAKTPYGKMVPTEGILYVGNNGMEWLGTESRDQFIQIPWAEVVAIRAQVFSLFKWHYIRGFYIDTKSNGSLELIVPKNAGPCLKAISNHLEPEQMRRVRSLVRKITGLFKKN